MLLLALASAGVHAQDGHSENADVTIEATDESYASVTNGEIEFHFGQLNQDAVTTVDDVFSVDVAGDQPREVWFDEPSGVTFYEGDDRTATIDDDPLTIGGGRSASIGLAVDTREPTDDDPSVTIYTSVEDGLPSGVSLVSVGVDVAIESAARRVDGNGGSDSDGDDETESDFTVESGTEFDVLATYEYEPVDRETDATPSLLSNGPGFASAPADSPFTPLAASGERETFVAELSLDGIVRDSTRVTLEPGEQREVRFSTAIDEPGVYDISVNGHDAGTVTVDETNELFTVNNVTFTEDYGLVAIPLFGTLLLLFVPSGRRAVGEGVKTVGNRISSLIPSFSRRRQDNDD